MKILNRCLGVITILITSIFLLQSSVYADDADPFASSGKTQTIGNIDSNGGKNSKFNNNENTNKKDLQQVKSEDKGLNKDEVLKHLNNQDIDYINAKLISNYIPYYQKPADSFDFSTLTAHTLANLFTSLNHDIVYAVFDKAFSLLFDLTNVQNSTNDLYTETGTFNSAFFKNKAFKELLYLAFAAGVVTVFIKQIKDRGGIKILLISLACFVLGSAWIAGGGTVLKKINNLTSTAEVTAFQATNSTSNVIQVSNFQQTIRYQYFKQTIERPFYEENFNTTENKDINTKKVGDPIDFIRGAIDNNSEDVPDKNPNMNKDGKKSWYQFIVAFVSPTMSAAYGVPLFAIGVVNVALQFASVMLYFFAPFAVLMSLFPRFALSGIKTVMGAIFILFGKVFLILGIVLLNWVQGFTDHLVPPTDNGGAILNALLYITFLYLVWRNKGRIFGMLTGSSVAERVADKVHVRKPYEEMKQSYGKAKDMFVNGRTHAKNTRNNYQKAKNWTKDKFGKGNNEEPPTQQSRERNSDPEEVKNSEHLRQQARNRDRNFGNNKSIERQPTMPNNQTNEYSGHTEAGEVEKAKQKRQAARSFVLQKQEYDGKNVQRDESKRNRMGRDEV
ncbi:ABC-type antimicrobial peptide transport system, permease component [Weissella oryzae SG25]|uniref:ABC-type antimicrobial peptide transport system, permease component n=1 Tax=Weissella oryzae (strain DSM 25784 / JCM 18191 / LMG 30913 / SG25) TaxID=1329250 RepID=A0A069CX02_WEIOS|nr:DoxX family protein [Weissella oryzae]GAK31907.1 ABC-type antimicrobial peptide transport system, permease component [Weissella oryzae SG25]